MELVKKAETFWQPPPLSDYRKNQQTILDLEELDTDFWPEGESIDDFVAFVRQQRREGVMFAPNANALVIPFPLKMPE